MEVVYKEIKTTEDINQCIDLQRKIFELSDIDLISPPLLCLIARDKPPVGIALGMYNPVNNNLIGFIIGLASFIENSVYGVIMGIKQEFQNIGLGYKFFLQFRETALNRNITCMYGIFNPFETNLAHLYFANLGFTGFEYIPEAFVQENKDAQYTLPNDNVLVKWDLNTPETINKISKNRKEESTFNIETFPIVSVENYSDAHSVLVEIYRDFNKLMESDFKNTATLFYNLRTVLTEYINKRNYIIKDCITIKYDNSFRTFYLLVKS